MTETGTKTWHELAEAVEDYREAVDSALAAYERGVPIQTVMDRLKGVRGCEDQPEKGNTPEDRAREFGKRIAGHPGPEIARWLYDERAAREHRRKMVKSLVTPPFEAKGQIEEEPAPDDPAAHYQGHHYRGVKMDPYRIADIYLIPAGPRWQILKKTLRGTSKGQSEQEVINEIRSALDRWQEMLEEDHG